MDPVALPLLVSGNALLLGIFFWYFRRFQKTALKQEAEAVQRERELKRRVLELQVLRSLGERAGYSLDLRQILEIIADSLEGLVSFSTVSYLLVGVEGKIFLKIRAHDSVSRLFLDQVKSQLLNSFAAMVGREIPPTLVEETLSGRALDDRLRAPVGSFFNLPLSVGGKVVALINVSSTASGLYGDEETVILYTILNQVSSQATKLWQVLENEKRRLSAMISSLSDGIIMVDPDFNLIVSNPAADSILSPKEEGNLFAMLESLSAKVDLRVYIEQALSNQKLISIPEFELGEKAIQIDIDPVKDRFGYLLGAAVILHDVSEERQLQRLREDFTTMMVHELRTPLTTITYGADMVLVDFAKFSPVQIKQSIASISASASQMLTLVNELLDVAKMEAGKFAIIKKEGDINKLIEARQLPFAAIAERKKLAFSFTPDLRIPEFHFDTIRIGQVIDNLLANAFKYTDQGSVQIKTQLEQGIVLVSVADSGEGLKPEDIRKLFSKFEQLGKGKTGEKGGTGLGLVVSQGIIESHGGKIWAASGGLGMGSTFAFSLPLAE